MVRAAAQHSNNAAPVFSDLITRFPSLAGLIADLAEPVVVMAACIPTSRQAVLSVATSDIPSVLVRLRHRRALWRGPLLDITANFTDQCVDCRGGHGQVVLPDKRLFQFMKT